MKIGYGGLGALTLGAAMLWAPAKALAQEEAIAACRATPGDAERIACLEEALRDASAGLRIPNPFAGGRDADPAPAAPADPAQAAGAMGAEQVAVREGTFDDRPASDEPGLRMDAAISILQTDARGLFVMQLDNGQVWRQTESVGVPIILDMDETQNVAITTSGFGGYRMQLLAPDRRIVVERVR